MTDPDVTLKGILRRNTAAAGGEAAEWRIDNATIELDTSEVAALDESLEGMPINVRGHFETRERGELGARWVFKAHSAEAGAFSGRGGGTSSTPPPDTS
jgi:hypothetical protein